MLPTATALLVAALALAGVIVAGSGAVAADGTAEVDTDVITVSEDGTADFTVETDGVDAFEVVVGSEDEVGYELRATVTPDDDGVTTLVFDRDETGGDGSPLTADGGGAVEIDYETSLGEAIAPGGYDAELFVGGEPADVSTLVVEEGPSDGDGSDGGADDGESVEPATVSEADIEAADIVVAPAESELSVPVAAEDGESVALRIRSAGDTSPGFLVTEEATVENGTASATFDLSQTTHGDRATLTVGGDESTTREVLVVDRDVGVEESDGDLGLETPGFGVLAGSLAVLVTALAARRRK
jgi:PGF-CTERM protein